MSDSFWFWMWMLDIALLFTGFIIIVYKASLRLTLDPEHFRWERAVCGLWCLVGTESVGEQIYLDVQPGPRVFLMMIVSISQIWIALTKFQVKKEAGYE